VPSPSAQEEAWRPNPAPRTPGLSSRGTLLRRVFAIEVLVCPPCSGSRRILGAVTEPTRSGGSSRRWGWPLSRRQGWPGPWPCQVRRRRRLRTRLSSRRPTSTAPDLRRRPRAGGAGARPAANYGARPRPRSGDLPSSSTPSPAGRWCSTRATHRCIVNPTPTPAPSPSVHPMRYLVGVTVGGLGAPRRGGWRRRKR
jgi:hypothetical protein